MNLYFSGYVSFCPCCISQAHPLSMASGLRPDVDVAYREVRRTEVVFVCRAPNGTTVVTPAWMFDPAACEPHGRSGPRAPPCAR